jgi:hypothetical protein
VSRDHTTPPVVTHQEQGAKDMKVVFGIGRTLLIFGHPSLVVAIPRSGQEGVIDDLALELETRDEEKHPS